MQAKSAKKEKNSLKIYNEAFYTFFVHEGWLLFLDDNKVDFD